MSRKEGRNIEEGRKEYQGTPLSPLTWGIIFRILSGEENGIDAHEVLVPLRHLEGRREGEEGRKSRRKGRKWEEGKKEGRINDDRNQQ